MLYPKLFTTLKNYSLKDFTTDALAGVIVGIVALPLAIAFAIASGVSPEKGLITAILGGFIISFFGGSRVQIGGPTGAFVVIVYAIIQKHGLEGLWLATIMAGCILVFMGVARFGGVIKFIPFPVVVGFTSGIAVIIFSSQVKDFFGLGIEHLPADFLQKWRTYFQAAGFNGFALLAGSLTILIMTLWRKVMPKIPGSVIAILAVTFLAQYFHWPVETIGSRFGEIPHHLPPPSWPNFRWEQMRDLIAPATTIAILAGMESLLSAVIADGMIGGKHRSNMELVAQGIANIITPLFGGIPVTGAIARTTTNIHNGGRTPVAGLIHAATLLLIMMAFGKLAALIPLACLAGILVVVSYHMSEWRSFVLLLKSPRSDVIVLLTTFLLTVLFDLTLAIQIGMILSVFLFVRRMAMVSNVDIITREFSDAEETDDPNAVDKKIVPHGVEIYEINGPFFFGASSKFIEAMQEIGSKPHLRIIRMRNVQAVDATGLHVLKGEFLRSKKQGIAFLLSGVQEQPFGAMERSGFLDLIGKENVFTNIDDALSFAELILQKEAKEAALRGRAKSPKT